MLVSWIDLTSTYGREARGRGCFVASVSGPARWVGGEASDDQGGIFRGMFRAPTADEVRTDLGDKIVLGIGRAVRHTRKDLAEYREVRPGWVATSSERGLASWIHDRLWVHLMIQVEGIADVAVVDEEPTREFYVGVCYRIRAKRHDHDGGVNSYPTTSALDFYGEQQTIPIPTLEEVRLTAGYEWHRDTRTIGVPLLALHNSRTKVVWTVELPEPDDGDGGGEIVTPTMPRPTGPTLDYGTRVSGPDSEAQERE